MDVEIRIDKASPGSPLLSSNGITQYYNTPSKSWLHRFLIKPIADCTRGTCCYYVSCYENIASPFCLPCKYGHSVATVLGNTTPYFCCLIPNCCSVPVTRYADGTLMWIPCLFAYFLTCLCCCGIGNECTECYYRNHEDGGRGEQLV